MRDKIKILYIQETIGSGGVERRRLSLAKLLDKDDFQLKIICTKTKGNIADEIRQEGVEVIAIGILKSPFHWKQHRKVQKIIDEYKPNIIHGAVFEGVTMAAVNGFVKRVPIVIIEETSDPINRSWRGNLLMKVLGNFAHCAIGVSPASVDYLLKKVSSSKKKVKLINNGVAIPRKVGEQELQELRDKLGIRDELVIGSVGRMLLDEHKRFSDLIRAFCVVLERGVNAKLLLVGEGPELDNYKKLVKDLKIEDKVLFPGYQSDTSKYYGVMDLFCLVSAYEAFGLVLAEAMLHKLPVVASKVGGMRYIVIDKKTGFLVEKYQIKEIANRLQQLGQDKLLRKKLGENAYQRAISNYTEERYVKEVKKLYLDLLKIKNTK